MRAAIVGALIIASACTPREQCAASCRTGCCDLEGRCLPGTDPYACGGSGADCSVCLVGQSCAPDAGCTGAEAGAELRLTGTDAFAPVTAQGFTYRSNGGEFILVSTQDRNTCRDPGLPLGDGERVLLVNSAGQGSTCRLELILFDAGVVRVPLQGVTTIRSITAGDKRIEGTVDINSSSPAIQLKGTINAPYCGVWHDG